MENNDATQKIKPSNRKKIIIILLSILGALMLMCVAVYFLWFRPAMKAPISESLDLPDITPAELPTMAAKEGEEPPDGENLIPPVTFAELEAKRSAIQASKTSPPVCGDVSEMTILMVALDYRGEDYLYGLADVIRLVHIDFTVPSVEVVALPRALLVQVPPNMVNVDGPILLNQGYLFGTEGMGHFTGKGYGAGSLAETIQYNFGISVDYYLVIDFRAFVKLVDRIGGVEVDLPTYVDDRPNAFFPPGKQTLTGEEALTLARIRRKYSDNIRIDNQNLILQAIIKKMQQPATLVKLPGLAEEMMSGVLTDGSLNQIPDAVCLLRNLDNNNINFYNPGDNLIIYGWNFIPTMNKDMNIFFWDSTLVEWIYNIFWLDPDNIIENN